MANTIPMSWDYASRKRADMPTFIPKGRIPMSRLNRFILGIYDLLTVWWKRKSVVGVSSNGFDGTSIGLDLLLGA
ncbi:hypothetical protein [Leptospira yasudae]|uniref:hypothetical protein n=1 Tax=Leptospira yasudae TaxID=2202201 RepID=UPI0010910696|nr:hypothetical protein [Leptospira yasudae]TGM97915.1 hypothetical protein EHR10_13570 [Leptospira yasudae]